jgi:hypothetical protein
MHEQMKCKKSDFCGDYQITFIDKISKVLGGHVNVLMWEYLPQPHIIKNTCIIAWYILAMTTSWFMA